MGLEQMNLPSFRCTNHPEREGIGICVLCKKVFCVECSTKIDGINYCRRCLSRRIRRVQTKRGSGEIQKVFAAVFVASAFLCAGFSTMGLGTLLPGIRWFRPRSRLLKTYRILNVLETGLKKFHRDAGRYPTEGEGLFALVERDPTGSGRPIDGWNGPYAEKELFDLEGRAPEAYGNAILYRMREGRPWPILASLGANGEGETDLDELEPDRPGKGDDIVVWCR